LIESELAMSGFHEHGSNGYLINISTTLGTLATTSGVPVDMADDAGLCIQTEWTGTVTGTLQLQGRLSADLSWQPISEVTLASPAGSAGGQLTNIGNAQARFYQVLYTHVSGAGSLKVMATSKQAAL
jgi:hypothetical protein